MSAESEFKGIYSAIKHAKTPEYFLITVFWMICVVKHVHNGVNVGQWLVVMYVCADDRCGKADLP